MNSVVQEPNQNNPYLGSFGANGRWS